MKTITVKQPWAYLIFNGKDIENRTWPTKFRGRVLVHAGVKRANFWLSTMYSLVDEELRKIPIEDYDRKDGLYSAIIGSVEIIDCVVNHPSIWAEKTDYVEINKEGLGPIYNWVLANPILFPEPIPAKGKLSFWESGIELCHICGKPTDKDSLCERCDKYFCEKCSAKYNQFTQIDFNCCESCSI